MNLRILCSTCSNPQSPEFRDFTWEGRTLKCPICGRTIQIVKPDEFKPTNIDGDGVYYSYRGREREDYLLQTTNTGKA